MVGRGTALPGAAFSVRSLLAVLSFQQQTMPRFRSRVRWHYRRKSPLFRRMSPAVKEFSAFLLASPSRLLRPSSGQMPLSWIGLAKPLRNHKASFPDFEVLGTTLFGMTSSPIRGPPIGAGQSCAAARCLLHATFPNLPMYGRGVGELAILPPHWPASRAERAGLRSLSGNEAFAARPGWTDSKSKSGSKPKSDPSLRGHYLPKASVLEG